MEKRNFMFWKILEIEETKDVKKIKEAYIKKLKKTNPEDKPEEFKQLRQAYEDALAYAKSSADTKSPIEKWKDKLMALYQDFPRRIQVKEWRLLLQEDICISFDKKMLVEETLLKFFMDFYRIPHVVWMYLNEEFSFLDHIDELYNTYPKDFIDYVLINGIRYEDVLPYEMFIPGKDAKDIDTYIDLYLTARRETFDTAWQAVEKMKALKESHPYGDALIAKLEMDVNPEASIQTLVHLHQQYEPDEYIAQNLVSAYLDVKQYDNCEKLCKEILENSENQRVKWTLANCFGQQERYKEAIEYIHEIMNDGSGDQALYYELNLKRQEWNVSLITQYEKILKEDFENHQNREELTWAYLQNDFLDKALELSKTLEKEKMEPFNYYNLMSNIYIACEQYEKALPFVDSLLHVLDEMEDDGTKKTRRRLKRYPEILNRKGYCLLELKRDEEGMAVYDEALRISNDNADILTRVCQIAIAKQKYAQARDYAKRLIEVSSHSYHGYLLMAFILYYQHNDRLAFEYCNQSIDYYSGDLEAYILKIRIMARNKGFDGAYEILSFLEKSGLQEDPQVLFCKGLLKELEEDNRNEAIRYYNKAAELIQKPGVYNIADELFYRLLWLEGSISNVNKKKDYQLLLSIANRGLKENERHYGLKDYKAWLLLRKKKYKEALELYLDLATYPNHDAEIEEQIGFIYFQSLETKAKEALSYYLKSIEMEDSGNKRFYAGVCYWYLGDLEKAKDQFLILQKMHPESLDSYFRLSEIYQALNQLEDALDSINKTIEMVSDQSFEEQLRYYRCKVQILRRMKRTEEAVEVQRFIIKKTKFNCERKEIVEMYCQYGNFDLAKKEIAQCKEIIRQLDQPVSYLYDLETEMRMYVVLKDFEKVNEIFELYKDEFKDNRNILQRIIYQINGDLEKECELLHQREAIFKRMKHGDGSHIYMNLAQCYFRMKNTKKQKEYARKALRIINRKLEIARLDRTLYYGRKAKVLALLNKEEEARKYLKLAKESPLCDYCQYCSCKDADVYETNMEEFFGNTQKMEELANAYLKKWPDQDDFVVMLEQLKKREDS